MSSIADELQTLSNLLDSGALTNEEFAEAKRAILQNATATGSTRDQAEAPLAKLELQNELLKIEQEWEKNIERYKVRGKIPKEPNVAVTVLTVALVIVWTMATVANETPGAVLGVFGVLLAIVIHFYRAMKYESYKRAYDYFHRRRLDLIDKLHGGQPDESASQFLQNLEEG